MLTSFIIHDSICRWQDWLYSLESSTQVARGDLIASGLLVAKYEWVD